jgi:hypothetical protein
VTGIEKTLRLHLALLKESGADRFDPARFCYIESLARRAIGKQESVCRRIERKAFEALAEYQTNFDRARSDAANIIVHISSKYPESADRIRRLFEENDFKGVKRLSQKLHRGSGHRALVTLMNQIAKGTTLDGNETQLSFDDLLRKQEDEVIQSFGNSLPDEGSTKNRENMELRSFHLFKKTWKRLYYDRLVTRAIKERPENPGPLNAQMLAIRSLSAMRSLSPGYLNRFVSYIDTLLWLERAGENIEPRIVKKRNR